MVVGALAKGFDANGLRGFLYVAFYGVTILLLLFVAFRSFSDVVDGESPFTIKQVFRFRFAGFLLLALVLIDALLSTGFAYGCNLAGIEFAALGNYGMDNGQIRINAAMLFFAVILYGISVLFRYGVLLQRLTDETE